MHDNVDPWSGKTLGALPAFAPNSTADAWGNWKRTAENREEALSGSVSEFDLAPYVANVCGRAATVADSRQKRILQKLEMLLFNAREAREFYTASCMENLSARNDLRELQAE